jgi:conjugative relaxase-like TrwC/TraI family protein
MVTLGKPMSSGSIVKYHTKEDQYYTKEGDSGSWYGKGAEELGLVGKINPKDLEKIVMGQDQDGNQLIELQNLYQLYMKWQKPTEMKSLQMK